MGLFVFDVLIGIIAIKLTESTVNDKNSPAFKSFGEKIFASILILPISIFIFFVLFFMAIFQKNVK